MEYQLKLKPRAEKELEKLPKHHQNRITNAMLKLRSNPWIGKKLDGEYDGQYSLQVWPYRIIYHILKTNHLIIVVRAGHRQNVYK